MRAPSLMTTKSLMLTFFPMLALGLMDACFDIEWFCFFMISGWRECRADNRRGIRTGLSSHNLLHALCDVENVFIAELRIHRQRQNFLSHLLGNREVSLAVSEMFKCGLQV